MYFEEKKTILLSIEVNRFIKPLVVKTRKVSTDRVDVCFRDEGVCLKMQARMMFQWLFNESHFDVGKIESPSKAYVFIVLECFCFFFFIKKFFFFIFLLFFSFFLFRIFYKFIFLLL